jgi:hypothetical protein
VLIAWLWLPAILLMPIVAGFGRAPPRWRKIALVCLWAIGSIAVWPFAISMEVAATQTPLQVLALRVGVLVAPLGITTIFLATVWKAIR